MSKRKPPEAAPPENHERWIASYADMVTLLFALFVVLSILGGVALALASIALIVAFLIVEIRNPTKAPTPEL